MPQFYYPSGQPVEQTTVKNFTETLDKVFGKAPGKQLGRSEMEPISTEIFKVPKIFNEMIFQRIVELKGSSMPKVGGEPKLTRQVLHRFWEEFDFQRMIPKKRLFTILAKANQSSIATDDFKPMFNHLLEHHPGLEFLQQTPEF